MRNRLYSEGPSLTKVEVRHFPLLHFPRELAMSLRRVNRSVICKCQYFCHFDIQHSQLYRKYYFLCHRNSPSKRFSEVSIATSSFSIFIYQNTKSSTGLNIYNILEECRKALLKMFLIDVDRLTLPRSPQDVTFEYIF